MISLIEGRLLTISRFILGPKLFWKTAHNLYATNMNVASFTY